MFVMCGVSTTLQVAFHCNISDPKPILNPADKHEYFMLTNSTQKED